MKKVAGLSVLCFLFFGNVHADQNGDENKHEYSVKSWSIKMEQHGDEPIQVRTEREESNENGIIFRKKTSGIIDKNGRFIENKKEFQPKVQQKKQRRWWNPFLRDDETVEEVKAPEHWKDHAREHPELPPCNQVPGVEVPKYPEPRTSAYPQNKNCWKRLPSHNQAPVCNEDEDSRSVRFDGRRHRNSVDPCYGAPNPRHIVVHSCEFGDNRDDGREERFAKVPPRREGMCPLEQHSKSIPNQQNYQELRRQNIDQQQRPVPSQRNYQEPSYRQPVEQTTRSQVMDPWGFSDDFFRTWEEFDKQLNKFFRER